MSVSQARAEPHCAATTLYGINQPLIAPSALLLFKIRADFGPRQVGSLKVVGLSRLGCGGRGRKPIEVDQKHFDEATVINTIDERRKVNILAFDDSES